MTVLKIFCVIIFLPFTVLSQTVTTKKESSRIDGQLAMGHQVELQASAPEIKASLTRFVKTLGKTKSSGDYLMVTNPVINGKSFPGTVYATTKEFGSSGAAWIGVVDQSGEESSIDNDLQKLVREFGITFHRETIQLQIDESMRALQAVEKQQLRLSNQNKDLNNKVESNKRQKLALEKALEENKVELEDLIGRIAANEKAQDSVATAASQIRKVVEMHKEKQRRVN